MRAWLFTAVALRRPMGRDMGHAVLTGAVAAYPCLYVRLAARAAGRGAVQWLGRCLRWLGYGAALRAWLVLSVCHKGLWACARVCAYPWRCGCMCVSAPPRLRPEAPRRSLTRLMLPVFWLKGKIVMVA